jgi:predicted nucleic acid-binding protein
MARKIFACKTYYLKISKLGLLNYGNSDGLGGRDATILAAMNSQSIKTLVSHDDAFKRLAEKMTFKIIDPVRTL